MYFYYLLSLCPSDVIPYVRFIAKSRRKCKQWDKVYVDFIAKNFCYLRAKILRRLAHAKYSYSWQKRETFLSITCTVYTRKHWRKGKRATAVRVYRTLRQKSTANQRYAISYWWLIVTVAVLLAVCEILYSGLPSQILNLYWTKWALAFVCFSFFFVFFSRNEC